MSEINPTNAFVNKNIFWHEGVCGLFAPRSLKIESFHNIKLFRRLFANGRDVVFVSY